jgi:sugar/nucleoside kinase (ribokinase family)
MSILVVGSVALDSVETPFGQVQDALGGAATYFSLAAGFYTPVQMVAVVGEDFPQAYLDMLQAHHVDVRGVQRVPGKTFRWGGKYHYDMNNRDTLFTNLGVFADFHPQLPEDYKQTPYVFLANINPGLQSEVLDDVHHPQLAMMDTMNFWISGTRDALDRTISSVDIVTMNEAEARQYADTYSLQAAARNILERGPKALIVKKGEYGAVLFAKDNTYFVAPAYPLEDVKDPTGAGDTFAGGFMGYLARSGEITPEEIKRAIIHGSVLASFCCEDFRVNRLMSLTMAEIQQRYREFKYFTHFDTID